MSNDVVQWMKFPLNPPGGHDICEYMQFTAQSIQDGKFALRNNQAQNTNLFMSKSFFGKQKHNEKKKKRKSKNTKKHVCAARHSCQRMP